MELKCGATVKVDVSKKKTWMSHFETNFIGLLGPNHRQQYRHGSTTSWTVIHPKRGAISWYDSDDLTVIKPATTKSALTAWEQA